MPKGCNLFCEDSCMRRGDASSKIGGIAAVALLVGAAFVTAACGTTQSASAGARPSSLAHPRSSSSNPGAPAPGMALTACARTSPQPTGKGGTQPRPLPGNIIRLRLCRYDEMGALGGTDLVTDRATVHALVEALNALPRSPTSGATACPSSDGSFIYIYAQSRRNFVRRISGQLTGCEEFYDLGTPRWDLTAGGGLAAELRQLTGDT